MSAVQLLVVLFVAATSCHDVVRVPLQQVVFRGAEKHQIIAADGTTEEVIMAPKIGLLGQIYLGTPPQGFRVLMDTGSSDLYVGSVEMCKSTPHYCKYHDVFRSDLSDTYHLEKQYGNISLSYAEIKVYGPVAMDTLTVGGIRIPDVAFVPANGFYQAYHLKAPVDGILGLSFQEGSQDPSRATPNNNLIREPTFSLYIKKDGQEGSELILGGSDPKLYIGNLKYVNIIAKDELMVGVDSFAVDGVEISGADKYDAVVDTGSTAIYVPRLLYYQLPKQLAVNGQRQQLPCDQLHDLPNLNFRLGGHDFSLERDFYVSRDESGFCQILVFPTMDDEDPFVLGAVFLRKYYSEFNMNDMTIGFAPAV